MFPKILLLTLPLLLAGCSSLSEEECRAMSWYNLGYQDGEQGKTRTATRDYKQTCGEYGLRVDEDEWQRGYAKGLELYCIPELAYSKGREGHEYLGVCPNDTSFLTQFERGRQEYLLEQRLGGAGAHRAGHLSARPADPQRERQQAAGLLPGPARARHPPLRGGAPGVQPDPLPGPGDPVLLRELTGKGPVWPRSAAAQAVRIQRCSARAMPSSL